jgi:predicted GNAT family acetyltransferase
MFLRANLRQGGIVDRGGVYQATYAALLRGGEIAAVGAHCWNGVLVLQAPIETQQVAVVAVAASGRAITGIIGPLAQVRRAREGLALGARPTLTDSAEDLFHLDLRDLQVPKVLTSGEAMCRRSVPADHPRLAEWRVAYSQETLRRPVNEGLGRESRDEVERLSAEGGLFVLEAGGRLVSCCTFNARLPDLVQIGGVFTPVLLRQRGYARAVVAGALLAAREAGTAGAILFTGRNNDAAQKAYTALGFVRVGDYGLVMFGG